MLMLTSLPRPSLLITAVQRAAQPHHLLTSAVRHFSAARRHPQQLIGVASLMNEGRVMMMQ